MPMRELLRRGLATFLVLLASCAPAPTAKLPLTCGPTTGGLAGAETQLRFVEASDTEIVLTFGAAAPSHVFNVPAFQLTPLDGAAAARADRLAVKGTATRTPDRPARYSGPTELAPRD